MTAFTLVLLVAWVGPSAAYWDDSLCAGAGLAEELCTAPWTHEEAPVLRLAAHPDRCLAWPRSPDEAGSGGSGGVVLEVQACNESRPQQRFATRTGRGELRLESDATRCLGVFAVDGVADLEGTAGLERGHELRAEPCGDAPGGQLFDFAASGAGAIRWATDRGAEACLTVVQDPTSGNSHVEPAACRGGHDDNQTFLVPRPRSSSAFVGVNLGGWLIVEDWMWPAKMEAHSIVDEFTLIAKNGGPKNASAIEVMHRHWDVFLRPSHLDALRRLGVTHVRIPVGWWLVEPVEDLDSSFVAGGEPYLRRALIWLQARGMRAVLDMHALPGSQARNSQFTGKASERANFFLHQVDFDHGKHSVEKLAELILKYEKDPETSDVVVGIQLMNEPNHDFWNVQTSIQVFYEVMVPRVRRILPARRYFMLLGFMDSPHTESANWLHNMRLQDPWSYAGVIFDAHLYHLYGDNMDPWTPGMDSCKTCCRDPKILEPMAAMNIPTVVGEFSLATGFSGWSQDGFADRHMENQLSLWNTTRAVVGSFLWNFRIELDPQKPEKYMEWSLLDMVSKGHLQPDFAYRSDLSTLCPSQPQRAQGECPSFSGETVLFSTPCEWLAPARPGTRRLRGGEISGAADLKG